MDSKRRKVAILSEVSHAYSRGLVSGVTAYSQQLATWSIYFPERQQRTGDVAIERLKDWKVDGILARIETDEIADAVRALNVPTVDMSASRCIEGIPWVEADNRAIARLAADHLGDRGFTNFAYFTETGFNSSAWRELEFRKYLQSKGRDCESFELRLDAGSSGSWQSEMERLKEWVVALPKPVGVFASYDIIAHRLLELCREIDVAVPEQVAVIGVDNDALICDICCPTLTSIEPDAFGAGFHAGELLDKMLDGEEVASDGVLIRPIATHERLSTDTVAVDNPCVAKALRYIRENAIFNISVSDVVREVGISRRQLEIQLKQTVGRTPQKEIQFRRMDQVKNLLVTTDWPANKIAEKTGFKHSEYLSVVFSREVGCTMNEFRTKNQNLRDQAKKG